MERAASLRTCEPIYGCSETFAAFDEIAVDPAPSEDWEQQCFLAACHSGSEQERKVAQAATPGVSISHATAPTSGAATEQGDGDGVCAIGAVPSGGFAAAEGGCVVPSEAALQRTAHMFDGDDASAPSVGFATAKGSRVVPSEAALQRTAHMFDGDDASAPSVGFATAKGGRVVPSEAALQRTAHMFDGDDGSSTDNRAVGQSGSSLMHADHGSKVQSSWPAGGAGDCGAGKDRRVPPSRPFSAPSAVTRGGLARPTAGRSADSAPLGVRRAIGGTARSAKRGRGRFVVPTPVTAYGRGVAAHPTTTALPVRSTLGGSALPSGARSSAGLHRKHEFRTPAPTDGAIGSPAPSDWTAAKLAATHAPCDTTEGAVAKSVSCVTRRLENRFDAVMPYAAHKDLPLRLRLRDAAGGNGALRRPSFRELQVVGVCETTLCVTSENAAMLVFDDAGQPTGFDPSAPAVREMELRLIEDGCRATDLENADLMTPWTRNHLRWIIWRLAATERSLPTSPGTPRLTREVRTGAFARLLLL